MKHVFVSLFLAACSLSYAFAGSDEALVIAHAHCSESLLGPNGDGSGGHLKNISQGSQQIEVWHSHIAPGKATPPHMHESEELFVFFKGAGYAIVGGQKIDFEAPCTLVLPANVQHQVFNTGHEETDHLAILLQGSTIWNAKGEEMQLPWREAAPVQ